MERHQLTSGPLPERIEPALDIESAKSSGRYPSRLTLLVLVFGLLITGLVAFVAATVNDRNENRLLNVQVHEAGTVLAGAIPTLEVPLASAAAIGSTTGGQSGPFDQFIVKYVGANGPFVYASLCGLKNGAPAVLAAVGSPDSTTTSTSNECSFLSSSAKPALAVTGFAQGGTRLGYTYLSAGTSPRIGVYAEGQLPPHKRVSIPRSSSFSDLDFALYLGSTQQSGALLESSVSDLPIAGRHAVSTVPFANTSLTLVGTPTQPLGGSLSRDLSLIVSVLGVILALGAAGMTESLVRGRRSAEALAAENRQLYGEQRSLAANLQHALLPKMTPQFVGMEIGTRYVAGLESMDIGGDWFDVIFRDDNGFIFVVGDVSGRGVQAAMVMASLQYAIRAYAAEGDGPDTILTKLRNLLDVSRDGHFATVLCGSVNIDRHELTLASAGHFSPLLVNNGESSFVHNAVGVPIGTGEVESYESTTVYVPTGSTVLAFTDGLVERRGEAIDVGLDRLRETAAKGPRPLARLLDDIVDELTPHGSDDDTAILGLRWQD